MDIYSLADSAIQQKIGKKMKATRLRHNISQAKLASDAQVSLSSLKKIEKGEIGSFESFIRIMRTLGLLNVLRPLVEEEQMSPNEYYEFVNSARKKMRRRAAKVKPQLFINNEESEW